MKRSIVILICSVFLINSGLFLLTYYSKITQIKYNAKEKVSLLLSGLHDDEAVFLKISKREIADRNKYSLINDDEFIYYGELYDVISKQEKGDTLFVYCLHDKDEEDFQKSMFSYFNSYKNSDKYPLTENRLTIGSLSFMLPHGIELYPPQDKLQVYATRINDVLEGYTSVPAPPPRFIS